MLSRLKRRLASVAEALRSRPRRVASLALSLALAAAALLALAAAGGGSPHGPAPDPWAEVEALGHEAALAAEREAAELAARRREAARLGRSWEAVYDRKARGWEAAERARRAAEEARRAAEARAAERDRRAMIRDHAAVARELADLRRQLRRYDRELQVAARARVLPDGTAVAPRNAPEVVKEVIRYANQIARAPYKWGGGHGAWRDNGYDCSGSVSYALAGGGLLDRPLNSGLFMSWASPGPGRWITIYANPGHMFMVVAGLRFDTSGRGSRGTRWQSAPRSTAGFRARHPAGL